MFRASLCPSSGAYQLQQQPLFYRRNVGVAVLSSRLELFRSWVKLLRPYNDTISNMRSKSERVTSGRYYEVLFSDHQFHTFFPKLSGACSSPSTDIKSTFKLILVLIHFLTSLFFLVHGTPHMCLLEWIYTALRLSPLYSAFLPPHIYFAVFHICHVISV
jgi:hypothetical protein